VDILVVITFHFHLDLVFTRLMVRADWIRSTATAKRKNSGYKDLVGTWA
jgi:hypothetical protein